MKHNDSKDMMIGDKQYIECSREEYVKLQCQWCNDEEGDLNIQDGIDCPKCKNKGYIAYPDGLSMETKDCECKKVRIIASRLKRSGISKDMLEHYKFKNYETEQEWNKKAYDRVLEYCRDMLENKYWLYLSGITGCGKTHLCVAAFQGIVKQGKHTADYMNWNEEIVNLISQSKSYDNSEYEEKLKRLQSVDLLYIDDFLKLSNLKYSDESISMAFRILDARYRNNKPTIISSEISPNQLSKIDSAILGRISEKTKFGYYMVDFGEDRSRNYRLKNFTI